MKVLSVLALLVAAVAATAEPQIGDPAPLDERGDSGCYPFEDPDCCIDYGVCNCANGWFYEYNQAENGCQPPWGFLATSENGLGGFCCN